MLLNEQISLEGFYHCIKEVVNLMFSELIRPKKIVDLDAISHNYAEVKRVARGREVCPVVKSNAYGLGAVEITKHLAQKGCRCVYVSTALEGIELRKALPNIRINVLNGPNKMNVQLFKAYRLSPVLNNMEQLSVWEKAHRNRPQVEAILNVETGFNRLGVRSSEWNFIDLNCIKKNRITMIMSHLSCAAEDLSDANVQQQNKYQFAMWWNALQRFGLAGSLALDAHMVNTNDYPINQLRTGAAICGVNVFPDQLNLKPVFQIEVPVAQVEMLTRGEAVGYGATYHANKVVKIATIEIGYSHGLPRELGNKGLVFFSDGKKNYPAPIVGRISMGLTNCDVTDVPRKALDRGIAMLFDNDTQGNLYTINEMCQDAGRLDTEIMCSHNSMDIVYLSMEQRQRELSRLKKNKER